MPSEIDTSSGGGIADRLARLQLQQGSSPSDPSAPRPPPPTRRLNNVSVPIISTLPRPRISSTGEGTDSTTSAGNKPPPPPLPTRRTNTAPAPGSPPRLPTRRSSNSSTTSLGSASAAITPPPKLPARKNTDASIIDPHSGRSLPPVYTGQDSLPVQLRKEKSNGLDEVPTKDATSTTSPPLPLRNRMLGSALETNGQRKPALPPRLPPRRPTNQKPEEGDRKPSSPVLETGRHCLPLPTAVPPSLPTVHSCPLTVIPPIPPIPDRSSLPPPVPSTCRPAPPPLPATTRPTSLFSTNCLVCRDFSLADDIAASPHLSRASVPSLQYLATALCAPFPNSTIDIARAIFTWLHHNIAYDTNAFFSNNVRHMTSQDTLNSGLAVCAGYAGLFEELAVLGGVHPAHVTTVSGRGKGYGFAELKPGDPIPEFRCSHAWNAIYLPETGNWHLLDACWGAGHVTGPPNAGFHKKFNPAMFVMSPVEFGRRHFPQDPTLQHVPDPLTWEEFITLEAREGKKFTSFAGLEEMGFSNTRVVPAGRYISDELIAQNGSKLRFELAKECPHVELDLSKERLYMVSIDGVNDQFPFNPPSASLGCEDEWENVTWSMTIDFWNEPSLRGVSMDGRKISVLCVREIGGVDALGVSAEEWRKARGRKGMSWGVLGRWNDD